MIIHHMSDGMIRKTIDGVIVPKHFENIYTLANRKKRENQNGNNNTSEAIQRK